MTFSVLSVYFNGKADPRREAALGKFAAALERQRVPLCLVVVGDAAVPASVTQVVRVAPSEQELWCKEALLNVGLRALPAAVTKVCWMDADIEFLDRKWADKCAAMLDAHPVVQPHGHFVFLEEGEAPRPLPGERLNGSFAREAKRRSISRPTFKPLDFHRNHPGHAWAARREYLDRIGGFFPYAIAGHGDIVMAVGFLGHRNTMLRMWDPKHPLGLYFKSWSPKLKSRAAEWQQRANAEMHGKAVGYVDGLVAFHWWHGTTESRGYKDRGAILSDYDPARDVAVTDQGIRWTDHAPESLRVALDGYFTARSLRR